MVVVSWRVGVFVASGRMKPPQEGCKSCLLHRSCPNREERYINGTPRFSVIFHHSHSQSRSPIRRSIGVVIRWAQAGSPTLAKPSPILNNITSAFRPPTGQAAVQCIPSSPGSSHHAFLIKYDADGSKSLNPRNAITKTDNERNCMTRAATIMLRR